MGESLNPTLLNRITGALRPDFTRTAAARRIAAGALVVLAGVAAFRPDPANSQVSVIIAAHDLGPGMPLTVDDVAVVTRSAGLLPDGVFADLSKAVGRTVAGPIRRGEILTDVRMLGSRLAELTAGPDARIVPLHLSDAAVLDLVRPGDVVDVLGAENSGAHSPDSATEPRIVATDAVVVLVSAKDKNAGPGSGRVVLLALPAAAANRLAEATLVQTVTLTIH